jgi:YD repeat-containing protein
VNEISPVIKPRTGSYLLKMFLPNNLVSTTGSGNKVNTYQQVYLEAGTTYVFSGYVNSSGMTSFGRDGGLSLSFQNSSGTDVAESNRLNYATSNQVENGWTRLEVTYTPQTSGNYRVSANMKNAAKFAAFDDFQLEKVVIPAEDMPAEKQGVASSANLVQLGGLERWSASGASSSEVSKYWTYDASRAAPLLSTGGDAYRGYVFQVLGHPDAQRRASQTIKVNRSSDTTYMLSAWGKAMAATDGVGPDDMSGNNSTYQRFFGMIAEIKYTGSSTREYQYVAFDSRYDGWQYASGFIVPKQAGKTVDTITVYLAYDYNINTAWFDQITLTEEPAQTYTYNDDGKVVAVTTSNQSTDTYGYNGPDLTEFVSAASGEFDFTYDSAHNMTKATNDGVNFTALYDSAGNNTQSKLQKGTSGIYLQNNATYTSDGNHISTVTDVNNIKTTFSYDSQGRRSSQTTPTEAGNLVVSQTYVSGSDRINSN